MIVPFLGGYKHHPVKGLTWWYSPSVFSWCLRITFMANAVQGPYPSKVFWSLSSFHACSNVFGHVGLSWWAVSNARMECLVTKKRPIAMGCQFQSGLTFTPALPAVVWLWDQPSAKLSVRQTGKKNTKKASPSVESRKEWPFVNRVFLDQSSPFLDGVFVVFSGTTLDITWIYFFCRSSLKNILCICVHICIYISYIHAPCQSGDVSGRRPELLQFPLPTQLQDRRNLEPQSHAAKVASCSWRVRHPGGDSKLPQTCSWTTKKKL